MTTHRRPFALTFALAAVVPAALLLSGCSLVDEVVYQQRTESFETASELTSAGQVIQRLTIGEVDGLKASGAVKGGMLPKLEACSRALSGGGGRVDIMPGATMEALEQLGRGPISVGTELIA